MSKQTKNRANNRILDLALIFSVIIYCLAEVYNRSIPFKYALVMFLVVVIFMAIGLLVKSRIAKCLLILLILVGSGGLYYVQSMINKLTDMEEHDMFTVSFVVLNESPYESIEDLTAQTTLMVSQTFNNDLFDYIVDDLSETYPINGNVSRLTDDLSVAKALLNNETEVMILDESYRSIILEEYPSFEQKTRVIYSKEKLSEKDDISKDVNVISESFNIYISGVDVEGPVNTVSRSDVNIIMTVNPVTNEILLTSTPRDSYVNLGCQNTTQKDKLTHAGVFGVGCSVSTLENLYDIDINYYARVNFTSFIKIIDTLGSIDVYSHYSFTTNSGQYSFVQGMNTLNSQQALAFSRERYNVPGGDITRGMHQQEVIKGVFNKMISTEMLLNLNKVVSQVSSSVDTNFGSNNLSKLVEKQLNDGKGWQFEMTTLEGVGGSDYTFLYPNQLLYVMYVNEDSLINTSQQIKDTMERTEPLVK